MPPSPQCPTAAETPDTTDAAGVADDGRAYPGRVRGQRLEITPADLTMYSAITGRAPSKEERQRALTWSDADPMHDQIGATLAPSAALSIHAMRPWHPAALSLRLREIWFNGLTIKVTRPQISNWLRRMSTSLYLGRKRVKHATR
jgi:hypothetical protein